MKKYLTLCILICFIFQIKAQGVRGVVYGDDGEALSFATIYVEQTGSGTSTNQEAYYELQLKPGDYTLQYKFVGYETVIKKITVANENLKLDVVLPKQSLLLDEVTTSAKATDPANWMMRKAIAKSSYHRQQIDAYSARVYVKGKLEVVDIPFYMTSVLKREGIDEETIIITESVSEVSYRRPNQFSEKVVSIYASKKTDINANPMRFIAGSFYQDEIASVISPLSSKAFRYYRFKHLGAFMDGNNLINKIKVIPKVPAPNVFEGEIQLVEEDWALFRVDLNAQIDLGIKVRIRQVYQKINDLAWMPITHQFDFNGDPMGFGFKGKYLASMSNYSIELNPALPQKLRILDKDDDQQGRMKEDILEEVSQLQEAKKEEEIVVKSEDLSGIMKDYKKTQQDSLAKQDVIGVYNFKVDSGAYNQDSTFWAQVRPIPLSSDEARGYAKVDSLNIIQDQKAEKDSIANVKKSSFQITDILLGGRYYLDSLKQWRFKIYNPILNIQYNTVEGLNMDYSIGLKKILPIRYDTTRENDEIDRSYFNWSSYALIKPTFRYSVARNVVTGKLLAKYQYKKGEVAFRVGRYVEQFNNAPAVEPLINTSFTTLWEQNFMKIYEKDFLRLNFTRRFSASFDIEGEIEYEERNRLLNNADFRTVDWKREFTPNFPVNINPIEDFDGQKALTANFKAYYKPFVKYVIRNNVRRPQFTRDTRFSFEYFKGFKNLAGSEVDFDRLELGYRDEFDFGAKGRTYINTNVGGFLNNNALGFMDYAHFPGNRSFITQADPVKSFRLLDYYRFSTDQFYVQNFLFHRFRKLMITQIPATRFMGLKEGVFINYLYTPDSKNYSELGYSVEGIINLFRIEIATQYEDFQYRGWGVRVGISTSLGGDMSINVSDDE
ncbi:hypothetical protein MATR_05590 [Marivirga tractuosa]|uniref:Carboxypeptidase-like regulatory domain-containing protein n=1 Tax=Marivirga tractuosa (strain ATCC 23168 / DSM 4126 / NBRC 15989 / NCIMB 1408 / VKM B-1430 / H-43) TaxID=643867 RepID=E4TS68_MARTH|nr:DUF5686 and carboxypeptidase regulatory-like domain-containing protein [Marivirga tractuosa]ADR21808.1 hypothetical protein Ftrac_1820 [Marivirga tractuosa DSM 4126]BDD13734.1 hypothetical protein MATR_05590 [Marivirga tractuosa]